MKSSVTMILFLCLSTVLLAGSATNYVFSVDKDDIYTLKGKAVLKNVPNPKAFSFSRGGKEITRYRLLVTPAQFAAGFSALTHPEIDALVDIAIDSASDYEKGDKKNQSQLDAIRLYLNELRALHGLSEIKKNDLKNKIKDEMKK